MTDATSATAGGPDARDALLRIFAACWSQVSDDLEALLQHPVAARHQMLLRLDPAGLKSVLPGDGVAARIVVEAEPASEMRLVLAQDLAVHLAGAMSLARKEDIEAKLAAPELGDGDLDAAGEVANIIASSIDESLRLESSHPMHLVRREVARVSTGEGPAALLEGSEFAVEVLTLALPERGEGRLVWYMPGDLAGALAGTSIESLPASPEEASALEAAAAAAAPEGLAGWSGRRPAGGPDDAAAVDSLTRALVAGPVAQDNRDIEEVLKGRGFAVVNLPHLKAVSAAVANRAYDLVVLATPPRSLSALSLLREAAGAPGAPPFVVATRRPTPGYVFQSVRAGARYVAVLPLSDGAADRIAQFVTECRRAA